jgi:hypothetical protein
MKTFLLLTILCSPLLLMAQNGLTVGGLAVDAGTVTFNVSWDKNDANMPALWSDTAWVFVDYNDAGMMKRLPLSTGATLTATSAPAGVGKVIEETGNNQGVWVVGNARSAGSFSATVKLLTAAADFSGACVYGSNYPPVGKYTAADKITFTGTPPYDLVFSGSGGSLSINGSDYTIPSGVTIASFTDKTGAPGKLSCMPPATYTLSGSDVCLNGTVSLTLSGSQSGWRYQLYKGSTAIGAVVNGTGSALAFTEAATATGTFNSMVQTIDPTGAQCEMPASSVQSITVRALPLTPDITGAATVCVNAARTVYVTSPVAGATYTWMASTGTQNGSSYTFNTSTDGAKTATVYSKTTVGGVTCQSLNASAATVTVYALPSSTVTAKAVCLGQTAALSATVNSAGTTSAMTYTWKVGAAAAATTTTNSYTTSALTATSSYTVQLTNSNGCSATSNVGTVTVNALPSSTVTGRTICSGQTSALSATVNSAGTTSAMTYSWKVGAAAAATTTTNSYTTSALTVTSSYTVQLTNSNGCSATSNVGTVTVNALPSSTVTGRTICSGQTSALSATVNSAGTTSAMTYSWKVGAASGTTTGNSYTTAALTTTTSYTVQVTNSNGCSATSNVGTVTVNVLPAPPAVTVASFCYGLPGQLQATASGSTVTWYDAASAGFLLSTGSVLSLTPLYSNAATYYAQATASNGCVSSSRTQASYTVSNCMMSGACPNFTAGDVGASTAPVACGVFYSGQIGATGYPAACVSLDAGRIGGN